MQRFNWIIITDVVLRPAPVDTQHNAGFSAAIRSIVDPRALVSFGINEVVPRLFGSLAWHNVMRGNARSGRQRVGGIVRIV